MDQRDTGFIPMSSYERAVGWLAGLADVEPKRLRSEARMSAREALRRHFTDLYRTGRPVVIAFSGGVDSSLLLAVATEAALDNGFDLPTPLTVVYENGGPAVETEWQKLVLSHLGLERLWERISLPPHEDLVGPAATEILERIGVCWPAAYLVNFRATCAAAPDGAFVITGDGGDEALGVRRITALAALARHRRISKPAARSALKAVAPREVRTRFLRRARGRIPDTREWLQPAVRERSTREIVADDAAEPLGFDRSTRYWANRRAATVGRHNMACLARWHGVEVDFPLWTEPFAAALGSDAGTLGWLSRRDCVAHLAGDLLPRVVVERRDKAAFNTVMFGPSARALAREWDGTGLNPELVDPEPLRREWLRDAPHGATLALLQEVALLTRTAS